MARTEQTPEQKAARKAARKAAKERKEALKKEIDNSLLLEIIKDKLTLTGGGGGETPRGKIQEEIKALKKENADLKKQLEKIKTLLG